MKLNWIITIHLLVAFWIVCSLAPEVHADPDKNSHGKKIQQKAGNQGKFNKIKHDKGKQDKGPRGSHGHYRGSDVDGVDILISAGISYLEARRFAEGAHLIGYDPLPPGIQKNLLRGKPLPPGIAKKMLPGSLIGKLPVHPGYRWEAAGRDLVLIHMATHVVADILYDVFK